MDTLIVFCALVFSASLMSLTWTGIYCLLARNSRRKQKSRHAALSVNPFEPTDASMMHYDPRITRHALAKPAVNADVPVRPAMPQHRRKQRLDRRVAPLNLDRSLPVPIVKPRRVALPKSIKTERPQRLLAC